MRKAIENDNLKSIVDENGFLIFYCFFLNEHDA